MLNRITGFYPQTQKSFLCTIPNVEISDGSGCSLISMKNWRIVERPYGEKQVLCSSTQVQNNRVVKMQETSIKFFTFFYPMTHGARQKRNVRCGHFRHLNHSCILVESALISSKRFKYIRK